MKTVVSTSDCNKRDNSISGSVHKTANSNIMNLHGTVCLFSAYKNQIAKTNCDYSGLSEGLFRSGSSVSWCVCWKAPVEHKD